MRAFGNRAFCCISFILYVRFSQIILLIQFDFTIVALLTNEQLYKPQQGNFYQNGDTGPCGPCSQIYFDQIGHHDVASLLNNDDPGCIEIWNLVFFQFNKEAGGILMPSSAKHVGTGLNFEQLTSILQKKKSKFDTDILMPTIDSIRQCTGNEIQPYSGKFGPDDINEVDLAYRIVADHIRTSSFAIADGSQPGIEIARNMLRRAIYFGHQNLKAKQRFLTILVSAFIESMSGDFPELLHNEKKIKDIIAEEEITFAKDKKKFKKKDSKRRKKEKNNTEQNVVVTRPPKVSYKTRTIDFFGRPTHIIHQHENGPCGLIVICNVLLLRSEIGLFLNKTEVMEDDLLSRIISRLKRCRKMQFELHEGFQYSEFQHKVLSVAKNLWREVCINVTFKSTDGFVFSPEYALFDYLEIPVFHGWLVDQVREPNCYVLFLCINVRPPRTLNV
jgi:hypothetical protein